MKLHLPACLVASAAFSFFPTVNADGIRGKESNQRRVLGRDQPATYLVQEIQYEHDESGRRLKLFEGRPERLDAVELDGGMIYTIVGGKIPPGWAVSGQGVMLPAKAVIDDATATITLPNSNGNGGGGGARHLEGDADVPKAENAITEDQERNLAELRRQLAVVTGNKSVLAVRVIAKDGQYGFTPDYLECKVFGSNGANTCGDNYNLKSAYSACSFGKLNIIKAANKTSLKTTVTNISNGVVTVTLPTTSTTKGDGTMRNAVTSALKSAFGVEANKLANHLMYCLPPKTMSGIAYAYVNSWNSVYSNQWCNYVSAQTHEIGHNLNLAHSGEGTAQYADQSGMMGYSYSQDDGPVMCFNAAKNYQLGWYSDKMKVVTPGAATNNCFAGDLYGTAFYGNAVAQTVGIKVNNSGSSTDYYIMYNAKTGIQSGTAEGGNQVMVVQAGGEGTAYAASTLLAKITTTTTGYTFPGLPNTKLYVDTNVSASYASIRIETNGVSCVPL